MILEILIKSYIRCGGIHSTIGVKAEPWASRVVARMKYFKGILDNGYVTLFDLINTPSAFILMVRLGADLTVGE